MKQDAFHNPKDALVSAPVLALPRIGVPFTVTTDASKLAVGATLEQDGRLVEYLSHQLPDAERNWHTRDQKALAFLISVRKWDVYLRGVPFSSNTDHEPIRFLQSKPKLSPRQQRWLDIFQQYDFNINHVQGTKNIAADALGRRVDLQYKRLCRQEQELRQSILKTEENAEFCKKVKKKLAIAESVTEPVIERVYRNFEVQDELVD